VNAQLVITGTSLKKRDLEVLANKVKDLLDAFEEEEEATPKQETEQPKEQPKLSSDGLGSVDISA
jgi:hypothetical protein